MWSRADVIGLFSNNVVSFSRNVVLRELLFSLNSVSKPRMLSVRTVYVLSSLHLARYPATCRGRALVPVVLQALQSRSAPGLSMWRKSFGNWLKSGRNRHS